AWPHPTPIRVGWGHAPPSSQLVRAMASFEVPAGVGNDFLRMRLMRFSLYLLRAGRLLPSP
ncbi:MAG: hypothetical protein ABW104_17630, partial [Candidatus Thiodiazotropha sp. 6PLUC2]